MLDSKGRYNIKINDTYYFTTAVGTGHGLKIGDTYKAEINGTIYNCIVADYKADKHTNAKTTTYKGKTYKPHTIHTGGYENGRYYKADNSVIEMVVDAKIVRTYSFGNMYNSM